MKTSHMAILGALLIAAPAAAQFKPLSEDLLTAVREGNGGKIMQLVGTNGAGVVNSRGYDGATPLTLAIRSKNGPFTDYFLSNGADPNLAGAGGDPPIVAAARLGWDEGVDHLLQMKAKVDGANRQGETALIVAVEARSLQVVRRLLVAGANPDRPDSAAGFSARDYAKRDNRARDILAIIEKVRPAPKR